MARKMIKLNFSKIERFLKVFKTKNLFGTILIFSSLLMGLIVVNKNKKPTEGSVPLIVEKEEALTFSKESPISLYGGKEYTLSYLKEPSSLVKELASFEENEQWIGDGRFDFSEYLEGKSSLFLASKNKIESQVSIGLTGNFNLGDYETIKFFLNMRSDTGNIEEFKLIFLGDDSSHNYEYLITNFHRGWNLIEIPVGDLYNNWINSSSERVIFSLTSKASSSASINLDDFWLEKKNDYMERWTFRNDSFVFLKKYNDKIYLGMTNILGSLAIIKEITAVRNYQYIVNFVPLKEGFFGLTLRGDLESGFGYYVYFDGIGSDGWKIFKQGVIDGNFKTVVLKEGKLKNGLLEKNRPLWLKAEQKNKKLSLYFSYNGVNFTRISTLKDSSFKKGKLGILNGSILLLVGEVKFFQQ